MITYNIKSKNNLQTDSEIIKGGVKKRLYEIVLTEKNLIESLVAKGNEVTITLQIITKGEFKV